MTDKVWTKEEIEEKLKTDVVWLSRGVVAIYKKQTAQEKMAHQTQVHNGVGFSGADAPFLTFVAEWLVAGEHRTRVSDRFVPKTRKMMMKYAGQLAKIANGEI